MARAKHRSKGLGSLYKRGGKGAWIAAWFDHAGLRREASTRTSDKAAAERILAKRVADAALRRGGVINAAQDRLATEGRKPLSEHVEAYVLHCRRAGQSSHHVSQKRSHLERFLARIEAARLSDLTADALEHHLALLAEEERLSARSVNFARQIAVAFVSWCVRTGRMDSNPLKVVPKRDETLDRRRVRRPLSDEELARLVAVADGRGRGAWYMAAALAGLRKGDLKALSWADVDFEEGTLSIRGGKAKGRVDMVPMHPQLVEALLRLRGESLTVSPTAKVFRGCVTDLTRQKDFLRAGLARLEPILDENGHTVMVGKGKRCRPKTRIVTEDEEGRVIDLHALRTTLGTQLARAGVAPQIAQRVMRHADYRTTMRHYTRLALVDTAKAVAQLPRVGATLGGEQQRQRATGTHGSLPPRAAKALTVGESKSGSGDPQQWPQQFPQQMGRGPMPTRASGCDDETTVGSSTMSGNTEKTGTLCESVRAGTISRNNAAGVTQLVECQLPKPIAECKNPGDFRGFFAFCGETVADSVNLAGQVLEGSSSRLSRA